MKSLSVTIQMKATGQYSPVVLFIMLYKVVVTLSLWTETLSVTIQMKAIEQYFPVVLYKMVLTFCLGMNSHSVTIHMKAIKPVTFHGVSFSLRN